MQIWTGESGDLSLDYSIDTATVVNPRDGSSLTIKTALERMQPDYLIITLGLNNGVSYCTEEKFKEYYGKLIDAVNEASPDTRIILQSVFPVSKVAEKRLSGISNDKIDKANTWIEELAVEKSVRYLYTSSVLKDKKGYLSPQYDSGDGVTLNESGYAIMLEYIRTHGYMRVQSEE
jgi:lysophospholipase L1-like esterase